MDFRVEQIEVMQLVGESQAPMQVVAYEMLVREEKDKQIGRAILGGLAVAANSYSAAQAGRGYYTTPSGRTGNVLQPLPLQPLHKIVRRHKTMRSLVRSSSADRRTWLNLEQGVMKDNTLFAQQDKFGSQLHLAPPADQGNARKEYSITINVGGERHHDAGVSGPRDVVMMRVAPSHGNGRRHNPATADTRRRVRLATPWTRR